MFIFFVNLDLAAFGNVVFRGCYAFGYVAHFGSGFYNWGFELMWEFLSFFVLLLVRFDVTGITFVGYWVINFVVWVLDFYIFVWFCCAWRFLVDAMFLSFWVCKFTEISLSTSVHDL